MSGLQLTKTRMVDGTWEGVVTGATDEPVLTARHQGRELDALSVSSHEDGAWVVRVTLPRSLLSDGVHTILLQDENSGTQLEAIHVMAGEPLDDDLRAEITLLREELDLLKRAFRRHCVETS